MRRSCPDFPAPVPRGRPRERRQRGLSIVNGTASKRGEEEMGKSETTDALPAALANDLDGNFEALVLAFQDRLYGFALRFCANREDAEEIAQDAFVRAYRALQKYPPDRIRALSLRAWLYQIALNVARNRFRRKRHRLVSLDERRRAPDSGLRGDPNPNPLDPADDPEKRPDRLLETRRERADVATLVRALPERYRAPLVLRYVEGLPVDEVAAILGQPSGTAKSNLHRAVNALRDSLSRSRSARSRGQEASR